MQTGFRTISQAFHLLDLNFLNYKISELEEITAVPSSLKNNMILDLCVLFPGKENQGSKKTIQLLEKLVQKSHSGIKGC